MQSLNLNDNPVRRIYLLSTFCISRNPRLKLPTKPPVAEPGFEPILTQGTLLLTTPVGHGILSSNCFCDNEEHEHGVHIKIFSIKRHRKELRTMYFL
jgi:hypothetical protein